MHVKATATCAAESEGHAFLITYAHQNGWMALKNSGSQLDVVVTMYDPGIQSVQGVLDRPVWVTQ